jgi:glutamyl-Q tRNA(Asp) synthetase
VYRGRFAPSPTGPLHFGSLVAAVGSYLEAKTHGGEWLVRIDDGDTPRNVPGAADDILRTLEAFGLGWDGAVLYQSEQVDAYLAAIEQLQAGGALYPCACSRREIADSAVQGIDGPVYPGTCRNGLPPTRPANAPRALRIRTQDAVMAFDDGVQGHITQDVEHAVGDFVVMRADGLTAYQLAVVVDDAAQGITNVVRGADLLDSTPRQIWLQQQLKVATPCYAHLPVALNAQGEKLSKQTHAVAIDRNQPVPELINALAFLHHAPPPELRNAEIGDLWEWALRNWRLARLPPVRGAVAYL